MRKYTYGILSGLLSIAFIIIVIGNITIVCQTAVTGTWKSENWSDKNKEKVKHRTDDDDEDTIDHTILKQDENKLHLSFSRTTSGRNQHQFGSGFDHSDLQGLSREQMQNGSVNFRIVREAGTIECSGAFTNGKGSGTFRFTPNMSYIDAMRSRGFEFDKATDSAEERLLSAALINVTTSLADDLKSVGFGDLDVDDLFKAAIFKIDSRFMAEMKSTGFPGLTMEDLVKARIFKIDSNYVRQVNDMGFAEKDFEKLVKFRIFKVTPEFLNEIKTEGLTDLDSEDIVKLRIFKIGAEYIRRAKQEDPNVTVEDLVQMKIGVHRKKVI